MFPPFSGPSIEAHRRRPATEHQQGDDDGLDP